jgi:hypothetical protein
MQRNAEELKEQRKGTEERLVEKLQTYSTLF